jgi:hypothetical protein
MLYTSSKSCSLVARFESDTVVRFSYHATWTVFSFLRCALQNFDPSEIIKGQHTALLGCNIRLEGGRGCTHVCTGKSAGRCCNETRRTALTQRYVPIHA